MSDRGNHVHKRSSNKFEDQIAAERDVMQSEGHTGGELVEVIERTETKSKGGVKDVQEVVVGWTFHFDTRDTGPCEDKDDNPGNDENPEPKQTTMF